MKMGNSASSSLPALKTVASCDTNRFMGTWYVVGIKPTYLETTCSNAVEKYTLRENEGSKKHDIDIDFKYNPKEDPFEAKNNVKSLPQKGWVQGSNRLQSGDWKVSPFWPIKMTYPIIELDEKDYSYAVIGYPSRDYCWILSRKPTLEEKVYKGIEKKLVDNHQYDLEGFRKVPQKWTAEERTKRGLTKEELPDSLLLN
jgi:apolipoprotein D and lipocalin family protein